MPPTALESLEADMDAQCLSRLGDTISYTPVAGAVVTRGYVNYRDALREIETGQVIAQDMTVQILISDAPVKPSSGCRVTLAKRPGRIYRPINVADTDEAATHWTFELEQINA